MSFLLNPDQKIRIQTFGRKKTSVAVALVTKGNGRLKVNGAPLALVRPEILRSKLYDALALFGPQCISDMDIRIRVSGGGSVSQIYAIRQALAKGIVTYYQKTRNEATRKEIRDLFVSYDRSLIVSDPRRCEAKKFGGPGARARFQKSYR